MKNRMIRNYPVKICLNPTTSDKFLTKKQNHK